MQPYLSEQDYHGRLFPEECDNGGIVDTDGRYHGCDELCRIMDGWECTHYYHHLIEAEYPLFTSYCWESSDPCSGSSTGTCQSGERRRRRLNVNDFDEHGRLLHHVAHSAYKYTLPANTHEMRNDKMSLHFNSKFGTNGQLRLIEGDSNTPETVFTLSYAMQFDDASTDDIHCYVHQTITGGTLSQPAPTCQDISNTNEYEFKQRMTYGNWMVHNWGTDAIRFSRIEEDSGTPGDYVYTTVMTTDDDIRDEVQYMGAHEFFWYPYKQLVLAKLSDGRSIQYKRHTYDMESVHTTLAGGGTVSTQETINADDINMWELPGKLMIQPVFWGRLAYFYVTGTQQQMASNLMVYQWSEMQKSFEPKCTAAQSDETTQNFYHKYSFLNVGDDGVLMKRYNEAIVTRSLCDATMGAITMTSIISLDLTTNSVTCGDGTWDGTDLTSIVFKQVRDDPDNHEALI